MTDISAGTASFLISADISSFEKSLKQVEAILNNLENIAKQTANNIKTSLSGIGGSFGDELSKKSKNIQDQFSNIDDKIKTSLESSVASVEKLNASVTKIGKTTSESLSSATASAKEMDSAFKKVGESVKKAETDIKKTISETSGEVDKNSKTVLLNGNQWMVLAAGLRHSTDAMLAGAPPMRILAVEGMKMTSIFSMSGGGVGATLKALVGAINPLVFTLGLLTAGIAGTIFMGLSWAHTYEKLEDTAKKTTIAIKDLQEMQNQADKTKGGFDLNAGMEEFTKNIREAQMGGGELARVLKENNIALTDANGKARDMKSIFTDVAALISKTGNEIDKNVFSDKLGLGENGVAFAEQYTAALKQGNLELTAAEQNSLNLKKKAEEVDKAWADTWKRFAKYARDAFSVALSITVEWVGAFYGYMAGIGGAFATVMRSIPTAWESMWKSIYNTAVDFEEDILNGFITIYNKIVGLFGKQGAQLFDFSAQKIKLSESAKGFGDSIVKAFSKYSKEAREEFIKTFQIRPDEIIPDMSKEDTAKLIPKNNQDQQIKGLYSNKLDSVEKYIEQLKLVTEQEKLEVSLFGKSNEERVIAKNLARLNYEAAKDGVAATQEQKDAVEGISKAYSAQYDQLQKLNDLQDLANSLAGTFTDALDGWIVKGEKFNQVISNILQSLASSVLQGGLMGKGPFASVFGMENNNGGLGGLFGYLLGSGGGEAAGAAAGGAGIGGLLFNAALPSVPNFSKTASSVQNINNNQQHVINFQVNTQNAESFRKSESQISAMLARSVNRGYKGL